MKPVRLSDPAEAEYHEALAWYRDRDPRVAERLANETRNTLLLIETFPEIGGLVPDVDDSDIRRMPIRGFPYHVVFARLQDELEVIAFAHNRRQPAYFLPRWRRS